MRISLLLSALLLGFVWNSAQPQSRLSEETVSRAFLSAQTEQKDDLAPHRGSGRRRLREDVPSSILGESLFRVDDRQQV
ncbi:hypothetical protein CKA32_007060 [Geitlerinema sp. FC II]|uniref:heterocyst-inhibiting protein PatX n=1 Tax=Baaleninema simplex TaxID=2862350 RepID=UPI00034DA505|nr:hypothetical protein [Baaleninema simplex]MDC0831818.1 hypothetical protein [Geitlerinema sp. CS-897]PPT07240.1 hypothetical protein CKA32_007060 [Geitlerinema sp. FC II]